MTALLHASSQRCVSARARRMRGLAAMHFYGVSACLGASASGVDCRVNVMVGCFVSVVKGYLAS